MSSCTVICHQTILELINGVLDYNLLKRGSFIQVGLKPAGGIKTARDAINWLVLVYTELGPEWITPDLFRIGASSLLDVVEKCLCNCTKVTPKSE